MEVFDELVRPWFPCFYGGVFGGESRVSLEEWLYEIEKIFP
jgi:hypothetical protein